MFDLSAFPEHLQKTLADLLLKNIKTPLIVCSKNQIDFNLNYFLRCFGIEPQQIFFPVKVNHDVEVLSFLKAQNTAFEIASSGELDLLKKLKIAPERIIFSNPVKLSAHIKDAFEYGIRTFAFDTESELNKIKTFAPGSKVYLRLSVSNKGAEWKLENKFGAENNDALKLLNMAINRGLKPCGIAFHVGWNNHKPDTFAQAIADVEEILADVQKNNIQLEFINIGGGFPAHCAEQYGLLDTISDIIKPRCDAIRKKYGLKIIAEPGSFILANAAVMICSLTDVIKRNRQNWVFLDSGICQGFQWIMGNVSYQTIYPYKTDKNAQLKKYTITGPTCDSHDIFAKDMLLPEDIKIGELLMIYPAGAYINSAKNYNGFGYPETMME